MTWETTYPTIADINTAHFQTLETWDGRLPTPETDVERTICKRIKKRLFSISASECREKAPEVANAWNDLADALEGMGIKNVDRI